MHLFSRGKKPRLDNFVVLLTKQNFHAKNGRKMAYFSLDCRYTPGLGTKNAPPAEGRKREKSKFLAKTRPIIKFYGPPLHVYEISSPLGVVKARVRILLISNVTKIADLWSAISREILSLRRCSTPFWSANFMLSPTITTTMPKISLLWIYP